MGEYLLRRLLQIVPTLFGAIVLTFVLMRLIPGDPIDLIGGQRLDAATRERIRQQMDLDDPAALQFAKYLVRTPTLNYGTSFYDDRAARVIVLTAFLKTLKLTVLAMGFSIVLGLTVGLITSVFKDSWVDRGAMVTALLGISTPVFWLGILLLLVAKNALGWRALQGDSDPSGVIAAPLYLVLPAITLGTRSVAYLARMTRSSMLEVLTQDYLRTARAKGLPNWKVIIKHATKNALIPVVTIIGLDFASFLSGAVLTETVFNYPGLGRELVSAIKNKDMPVMMCAVVFSTAIFILVNLLVDVLYGFLDPRIRLARKGG